MNSLLRGRCCSGSRRALTPRSALPSLAEVGVPTEHVRLSDERPTPSRDHRDLPKSCCRASSVRPQRRTTALLGLIKDFGGHGHCGRRNRVGIRIAHSQSRPTVQAWGASEMTILRQDFEWRVLLPILVLLTLGAGGPGPDAAVELTPEAPDGYADDPSTLARPLRQDVTSLRLEERGGGLFTVRMGTAPDATTLENIDLRPLIPRVPALARGDADLVRYALVQRELNRVETRYGPVTGADESRLANNCLRGGLWEAFLDRKVDSGMAAQFHAWFVFPKDKYSR